MIERLHAAIAAVCPIDGVGPLARGGSFGPGSVRIDYQPQATAAQRQAAQSVLTAFDWSAQADLAAALQQTRLQALQLLSLTDPTHPLAPVVWAVRGALYQTQDSLNSLRPNKVDRTTGKQEIAAKVQSGEADS